MFYTLAYVSLINNLFLLDTKIQEHVPFLRTQDTQGITIDVHLRGN